MLHVVARPHFCAHRGALGRVRVDVNAECVESHWTQLERCRVERPLGSSLVTRRENKVAARRLGATNATTTASGAYAERAVAGEGDETLANPFPAHKRLANVTGNVEQPLPRSWGLARGRRRARARAGGGCGSG